MKYLQNYNNFDTFVQISKCETRDFWDRFNNMG